MSYRTFSSGGYHSLAKDADNNILASGGNTHNWLTVRASILESVPISKTFSEAHQLPFLLVDGIGCDMPFGYLPPLSTQGTRTNTTETL